MYLSGRNIAGITGGFYILVYVYTPAQAVKFLYAQNKHSQASLFHSAFCS